MAQKIIAWDFDGVLNRNLVDGTFVWKATFDRDIGISAEAFSKYVFRSGRIDDVLIGKRDLIDLVAERVSNHGWTALAWPRHVPPVPCNPQ